MRPHDFWCNECQAWTEVEDHDLADEYDTGFVCAQCGNRYVCDYCGYDIDRAGTCLRELAEGEEHA